MTEELRAGAASEELREADTEAIIHVMMPSAARSKELR